jgi:hypothetical protein
MAIWLVQLLPNGPGQGPHQGYQKITAAGAKEAAEAFFGHPLSERGSNYQLRALVRRLGDTSKPPMSFYATR